MIRIAITGPESSGKTTLARQLSHQLKACLVLEYAREFFDKNPIKNYSLDDVLLIGKSQFVANLAIECRNEYVICDTEMTVIKIWCEDKFNSCPEEINNLFNSQEFDVVFLCKPEMEWQEDILREDANRRDVLFEKYVSVLKDSNILFHTLAGNESQRLAKALEIIWEK